MAGEKVRLRGLTRFDTLELGRQPGIEYEETKLQPGTQGEVTVFTAMIAMALISTLAAYLLKKHEGKSFEEEVEIVHPNGQIERRRIRWRSESSEAPDKEIIRQIQGPSLGE